MIIAPHEKYITELVKDLNMANRKPKATPDIAMDSLDGPELSDEDKHVFRSCMGTLLYLSQDRSDIQHAVRSLSQWMAKPTKPAMDGVRHLVLYLKGTSNYGLLLPYQVLNNSKLDEIHGKEAHAFSEQKVEVFSDSDWAGDKSRGESRRHSVSSGMVFLNARLIQTWSRTQRSIALSSCEAEYLASAGAGAEGLYVGRLWTFLTKKDTSVVIVTHSSSGKAFAQRLGVGRLKHVDVKFLWMQKAIKDSLLEMKTVATLLNVADLGTKSSTELAELSSCTSCALLFSAKRWMAIYQFDDQMQRKMLGSNMKVVRRIMLETLSNGTSDFKPKLATPLVKALTLLALQPMAKGMRPDDLDAQAIVAKGYLDFFMENYEFMIVYVVFFFFAGIMVGFFVSKLFPAEHVTAAMTWFRKWIKMYLPKGHRHLCYVDDWDPELHELRKYRVLDSPKDAWSGEEYFRETGDQGLARYVRPARQVRLRLGIAEMDPLEMYQLMDENMDEEHGEEETLERDTSMEVDEVCEQPGPEQGQREPSVARSTVTLPGSPHENPYEFRGAESNDPGPIPPVGVDWDRLDNILQYLPRLQAQRVERIHEVRIFNEYILIEYCKCHLMELFPGQPDISWDYAGWWNPRDIHGYTVFNDIVIRGKHMENFGAFCEQWFTHTDPSLVYPQD